MTHWVYALIFIVLGWGIALPVLLLSNYPERRRIGRGYGIFLAIFVTVLGPLTVGSFPNWWSLSLGLGFTGVVLLSKWKKP